MTSILYYKKISENLSSNSIFCHHIVTTNPRFSLVGQLVAWGGDKFKCHYGLLWTVAISLSPSRFNRVYLSVLLHSSIRICHDMSLWRHLLCIRFRSDILYLYRWNINPKTISHLSMTFTIPSALVWQTKNIFLILLRLLHQRRNKNERKNHVPLYNLCNCQYRGIIYCLVWAWISQKWVRTHARSSVISLHFSISSYPIPQSQLPIPAMFDTTSQIPA